MHGQLKQQVKKKDDHMMDAIRYGFSYIPDVKKPKPHERQVTGLTVKKLQEMIESKKRQTDDYGFPVTDFGIPSG